MSVINSRSFIVKFLLVIILVIANFVFFPFHFNKPNRNSYLDKTNEKSKVDHFKEKLPDTILKAIHYKGSTIFLRYRTIKNQYVSQIVLCNMSKQTEKVLVQTVEGDTVLSTPISYSKSVDYDFSTLGEITNMLLSPDNLRLYFETTTGWSATHYYDFGTKEIHFFKEGVLIKVYPNGNVQLQAVSYEVNEKENLTTYRIDCLYDKNGKGI